MLEAIDRVVGEGMRMAEKRCRKLHLGAVPFSPELTSAGLVMKLWRLVIRHKKGANINSRYIRRIEKGYGLTQVLRTPLQEAHHRLKQARATYNRIKRNARTSRYTLLQDKLNNAKTTKARKEIALIVRTEESRFSWRAINRSRRKR